ncbi:MAG: phospholipase [bacterium]|nr:phospholipase [bacterium]
MEQPLQYALLLMMHLAAAASALHAPPEPVDGQPSIKLLKIGDYPCAVFFPAGFNDDHRWPLVMYLHGAGERGADIEEFKNHVPIEAMQNRFVVIAPVCPAGSSWSGPKLKHTLQLLMLRVPIDSSRIYVTGISMGGFGTWRVACACPELIAAIAPLCGGGDPVLADRLTGVPTWAFHGEDDDIVPMIASSRMVRAQRDAGGEVKYTVLPDTGHNLWSLYQKPDIFDWFLEHRK